MFGSSANPGKDDAADQDAPAEPQKPSNITIPNDVSHTTEKRSPDKASPTQSERKSREEHSPVTEKRRRSSGVSRAKDLFSNAKNSLHLHGSSPTSAAPISDKVLQSPIMKLSKTDPALGVPQGSLNNSAGESAPGPKSTFRVGVTEDKNKKCRRTMEDTHAYLYNFLSTPAPSLGDEASQKSKTSLETSSNVTDQSTPHVVETDNGYFAIFDGHAGTFAADWCGKKLHLLLEDTIRKNPNTPIPELLDSTFTNVDQQLEKLPLKNSGCTAVVAVLRWEDRVPASSSATGSALLGPAAVAAAKAASESTTTDNTASSAEPEVPSETRLRESASRHRVLYTANVGDARIVLCRNGRALRLSYDHKGNDENEGRRVANAGGLILNNRVNGVLAVTRALGDTYMKDLVTGHPYTTETVIQPEQDEFLILACDGLWDVCGDQEAVDLIRQTADPQQASKQLVDHALARFSTDNLSCMVVRFDHHSAAKRLEDASIGVDKDADDVAGISEADAIVQAAKKSIGEGNLGMAGDELERVQEELVEGETEAEAVDPGPELNPEALKAARKN
ncbi:serine/threonine protein phosphatase [Aulographum hederae CBS 113979]|uniref:Serine/threonine protein phosphatase n=1 Tax=Aulographum hederae CBS 113979 TaxID=1176131 RepID=A0A6G1GR00_9PEZI|nr:serine/threonine protein phosphatase [Aulographum hederae CBS 113979]